MKREQRYEHVRGGTASGFTMLEMMVAICVTLIVMAGVFGILVRSVDSSSREMSRAQRQTEARHVLDLVSRDALVAGAGLPPEVPSFTPPAVLERRPHDEREPVLEVIGGNEPLMGRAVPMSSFDGARAVLDYLPTGIRVGALVLAFDDEPTYGTWVFGLVSAIESFPAPTLTLLTEPGVTIDSPTGTRALPSNIAEYNRPSPLSGFLLPLQVVTYSLQRDSALAPVLWRQSDWGTLEEVALVEDLEIQYFVGGTVGPSLGRGPDELVPQPNPAEPLDPERIITGVRIEIAGSFVGAHDGSSRRASTVGESRIPAVSTRVTPRNILYQTDRRRQESGEEP